MTIDDKIKDEKMLYDINRELAKISTFLSRKIDKYEDEEILPPDQKRVIKQAKFTYCPLGEAFEKQTYTIDDQGKNEYIVLLIKTKD